MRMIKIKQVFLSTPYYKGSIIFPNEGERYVHGLVSKLHKETLFAAWDRWRTGNREGVTIDWVTLNNGIVEGCIHVEEGDRSKARVLYNTGPLYDREVAAVLWAAWDVILEQTAGKPSVCPDCGGKGEVLLLFSRVPCHCRT